MEEKFIKFPKDFLWGVATSSYQIEGNNTNSDWWEWEQRGKTKEKSGIACDYWNRWKQDHELLSQLGVNSFRLSLEWSRIEPKEGKFSEEAIQHYREILQDLKNRNIKTQVTFWHWTSPIWFQQKYGFSKKESVEIFFRYGKKVFDELGNLLDLAVIINEPMMPLVFGFLKGKYPPGKVNPFAYCRAFHNLINAYKDIYAYIKEKNNSLPVGITTLYNFFEPKNRWNPIDRFISWCAKKFWNESFFNKIKNEADYFGLDYYFHDRMSILGIRNENKKTVEIMNWEIYPLGIYEVLKEIKNKYNLPIYIMENGLPDANDLEREDFIKKHLFYAHKAMKEGVDLEGYNYWSLMDNFEWSWGYTPRFGLVEIDYKTLERKPRKSFYAYKQIIKNNGF